ncbi:transcriptional regulator, MerR family protein [Oceaniovalibus guishaninsula JLT2003]|uniref:Transcriptional regulator, MerR family protein n=1 Tax=Oceaniovalibus guishaninsula JLT2003 TaxID=1231392 RepID=K2HS94_9RHOB|nr:MerR family transcriptional regulator [Oceaniovalibus guishaninsula]EKE45554.1 transcriptional regulator, MerR family protein [Oceaniovalibus guishaninsula JLT2003]
MAKSPEAFRTISEVAEWLDVPTHVLRFWESRFTQIKPVKRAGGRRYYRPADMELLGGIKRLLHDDGLTIRGVQKLLREEGVRRVASLSPALDGVDGRPIPDQDGDSVVHLHVRPAVGPTRSGERTRTFDNARGPSDAGPAPHPERPLPIAALLRLRKQDRCASSDLLERTLDRARALERAMLRDAPQ